MKVCISRILCLSLVICLLLASALYAANEAAKPITKSGIVEKTANGEIDWGKEMFYAVGEGAMPTKSEVPNRAKALLKAKDYAKMDAVAAMRMLIAGTSISYSATGKDYMVNDATLTQKIEGYVKNVIVLKTETIKQGSDTTVKVTVGCPMYGYDGPGAALLQKASELAREVGSELGENQTQAETNKSATTIPEVKPLDLAPVKIEIKGKTTIVDPTPLTLTPVETPPVEVPPAVVPEVVAPVVIAKSVEEKPAEAKIEPAVAKSIEPEVEKAKAPASVEVYTSVIVDTLGLSIMRAMSPKIRTVGGAEVYGTMQIDPDEVQDHGPVAYVRTIAEAKKSSRIGSNPLVIKAVGRAGGRRMCDVVLSDEDVDKLKSADSSANPSFLKDMRVVFVVDPLKL